MARALLTYAVFVQLVLALVAGPGTGHALATGSAGRPDTPGGTHGTARLEFALIGDVLYSTGEDPAFDQLVAAINGDRWIRWVLHAGDIKSGSSPCSDQLFRQRFEMFQRFRRPFVLVPGDNEWTDCHREAAGGYSPLERLAALRRTFYPVPGQTLGARPMPVETQAHTAGLEEFPEHVRWTAGNPAFNVVFATLHVVGSANGTAPFPGRTVADDAEVQRRTRAALAWLAETFQVARRRGSAGVFLMMQADPYFEDPPGSERRRAFDELLLALEREAVRFGRPVLLAHGDTHYFRYDKPLASSVTGRRIETFSRVETFGAADVHWVRVVADPRDPGVFQVRAEIVEANRLEHPVP